MSDTEYSRRDAWLTVALLVARDELPVPESLTVHEHGASIYGASVAEATQWAAHLGLQPERPLTSEDGRRAIARWSGRRDGVFWHIQADGPVVVAPPPSPLAAEVVAAILTPDAPSLPEAVTA